MKKLAFALLIGSLSPIALHAHCGVCGMEEKHDTSDMKKVTIDAEIKGMTDALGLDAGQQAKVRSILEKNWDATAKASSTKKAEVQKAQDQTSKEIRSALSKEQQATMDELSKNNPACCPTPWVKCPACVAKSSDKKCCSLAGKEGHKCSPKTTGEKCCPMGEKKPK